MSENDINLLLSQAMNFHRDENIPAAESVYRRILDVDPDNPDALHLLGIILMQSCLEQDGIEMVKRAVMLRGEYPEAIQNLCSLTGDSVVAKYNCESAHYDTEEKCPPIDDFHSDVISVGTLRIKRMYDFAACFANQEHSWLTIGDHYGHDCFHLMQCGIQNVVASSLEIALLKQSKQAGIIGDYLAINAEKIALPDQSFDYVLCKEALHHMPRPMLAIYEMLRVARIGVIMIEPHDLIVDLPRVRNASFWQSINGNSIEAGDIICNTEQVSFRVDNVSLQIDWSERPAGDHVSGNYVYTLSAREIQKMSYGMGLPVFGWKYFNDYYDEELCKQPALPDNPAMLEFYAKVNARDALAKIGAVSSAYVTAIMFKRFPSLTLTNALGALDFQLKRTPTRLLPLKWPRISGG